MEDQKLFNIIPAARFFKRYCQGVTNWTHKCRGVDGNKRPIQFTKEDRLKIKDGKLKLIEDIKKATV